MVGERGFEPPTPWSRIRDSGVVLNVFNLLQCCFNRLILVRSRHSGANVSPRMAVPHGPAATGQGLFNGTCLKFTGIGSQLRRCSELPGTVDPNLTQISQARFGYFLIARHAFRTCLVPKPVKSNFDFVPQKSGHEGAVSNAVTTA